VTFRANLGIARFYSRRGADVMKPRHSEKGGTE
jgi:hypothetical protein